MALVALLGAEPSAASAASLGGVASAGMSAASVPTPSTPPTLLMADSFTTAGSLDGRLPESVHLNGAHWVQASGKWAVRNGYLDPPMQPGAVAAYPAGAANIVVEIAATITSAFDFGVALWANSSGSTLLVARIAGANAAPVHTVTLQSVVGNSTTVLATATVAAVLPTFTISVTAVGDTVTMRRSGAVVLHHTLTSLQKAPFVGLTGVGVWVSSSGNEILDDIRAYTSS